jgi:iron complex transport system substrate-binding protein
MRRALIVPVLLSLVLIIIPVSAEPGFPCDTDGNRLLTGEELAAAILDTLDTGVPHLSSTTLADLRDAAFIYTFWEGRPLTVTDSADRTLVLERPLRRVAVFTGEALETLRALNFEPDSIVAIDKYSSQKAEFFPEFQGKESVGSVWSPDMEKLLSVQPDAVILYATSSVSSCEEIQEKLEETSPGIRVLRFDCYKPATYKEEISTISQIIGKEERGQEFLAFYAGNMETISGRVDDIPEEQKVRVYFEYWTDYKTASGNSGYHEKIEIAGGRNMFAGEPSDYPEIDPESVLVGNPQVIVKLVGQGLEFGGYKGTDCEKLHDAWESLYQRPGWEVIEAVKENRVHVIHSDILGSSQHFIGTAYFATWFYPDLFGDLDPVSIHRHYLTEYQHLNIDPSTQGGFVYP